MQETGIQLSLFEAAVALHATLEPGEVIQRALDSLSRLIEADAWAIFLKDAQAGHLEMVRALNAAAVPTGPFVDLTDERSPVAEAAREQRLVAAQSVLAAPLLAAHRMVGVVLAARRGPLARCDARVLE